MIVVSPYPIFLDLLYPIAVSVSYPCPAPVSVQHSKCVYTVKLNSDGSLTPLKVIVVARGYSHVYGLDYVNTFFSIAKMTYVRVFMSLGATYHLPLHRLGIKNALTMVFLMMRFT